MGTMKKQFIKEIFPLGKHFVSDSKGNRREIDITEERALGWINKFNSMRSKGLMVTAPWEHDINATPVSSLLNAKNNGGEWKSLYLEDGTVKGMLEAATDQDAEAIGTKVKGCSVFIDNFVDGKGTQWDDSILHICLTNNPVAVTESFENNENSLSIAMSTSMKYDKDDASVGTSLSELARTLKSKMGIETDPNGLGVGEYLKTLIAVFKNYYSSNRKEEGLQSVAPSMDIFMSTNEPTVDTQPTKEPTKDPAEAYVKKIKILQRRESQLLRHISSSVSTSLKSRINSLKNNCEEDDSPMKSKLEDLENSLDNVEFEFDFKNGQLSKTSLEGQIETMELFSKKTSPSEGEENKSQLTSVAPPEMEPPNEDVLSLEEMSNIVNSF